MSTTTLAISGLLGWAAAIALAFVARAVARREIDPRLRLPAYAFAAWWAATAALSFGWATLAMAAAFGEIPFGVALAYRHVSLVIIAVAVWGILAHFGYVLTGRSSAAFVAVGWSAVCWLVLTYSVTISQPVGVTVGRYDVGLRLASPPEGAALIAVLAVLGLPPVAAAIGYVAMAPRISDATSRWRSVLLAPTIALWITAVLASRLLGDPPFLLSRGALTLAMAAVAIAAYWPPVWARRRFAVRAETP